MSESYRSSKNTGMNGAKSRANSPIVTRVVQAVAAEKSENPVDMRPPLFDVIDPDALEAVCQFETASVEFEWQGYDVEIDENRTIYVTNTD